MAISINADAVISWLRMHHVGHRHGVTCANLAGPVRMSEREIRKAISELREAGKPVCGTPKTGYFLSETAGELEETCQFPRGRALTTLKLESQLRKVPLADLVGQMSLDLLEEGL